MTRRRGLPPALAASGALVLATLWHPACGSKSGLLSVAPAAEPSPLFCAAADYATGGNELAIYIVLDRSDSMVNDEKWEQASTALAAFVSDPSTAGIAVALSYFPHGFKCAPSEFTVPSVFAQNLPADADLIVDSLALQKPSGGTPTRPALHGAIEFSRALMIAEPSRRVVVALVTDGSPTDCESSPVSVANVAEDGRLGTPQVLTFAIGFKKGAVVDLDIIAEKGGTGKPILVSDGPNAGQELIDALRELREGQKQCRFAVPPVAGQTAKAQDVRVGYRLTKDAALSNAPVLSGLAACGAAPNGFVVVGDGEASAVDLCPLLCNQLHENSESAVTVVNGCAGSFDAGAPGPLLDGGNCGGAVSFSCVTECGSPNLLLPICTGVYWECPPGTKSTPECAQCAPVPHECCQSDGTLVSAQCIDGNWTCPPGGVLYGNGSCKAPDVCAATLPCAIGQYCQSPSFGCGKGALAGHCQPLPTTCPSGGPEVCGCNGQTFPNVCAAAAKGVDIAANVDCPAPSGKFACGPVFCGFAGEICRKTTAFGGSVPLDDFGCVPAPVGCATGCGCGLCPPCPPGKICNETCSTDPDSGGRVLACNQLLAG